MIQLSPHMRVFVYVEPADFRNGIDGLAGLCRSRLRQDPMSGAVFLFINRRRTALKVLTYDGQGFWLCQKRLSQGTIKFWPRTDAALTAPQVQVLLYNGDPCGSRMAPAWKPFPAPI
jgi:transposase